MYEYIIESYIDDYIVFEGFLKRDFLEVSNLLAEADNKNFVVQLWNKIISINTNIRDTVSDKFQKFLTKIDIFKQTMCDVKYRKYKDIYDNADFSNFTIKNYKLPNIKIFNNVVDTYFTYYTRYSIRTMRNDANNRMISILKDSIKNASKDLHKDIWKSDYIENPFKVITKKDVLDDVIGYGYAKIINGIKKCKKDHIANFDRIIKEAKEELEKVKSKESTKEDLSFAKKVYEVSKLARRDVLGTADFLLKETRLIFSNQVKLFNASLSYAKRQASKNESVDIDYDYAIGEAVEYEFLLYMED